MKRTIAAAAALLSSMLGAPAADAGPTCPDLVGTWRFTLSCVAVPRDPPFGSVSITGIVAEQQGCVFRGTLNGFVWVGAIAADGTVYTDHAGAKGVAELTTRRAGVYTGMNFAYTFSGPTPEPSTACAGTATRD